MNIVTKTLTNSSLLIIIAYLTFVACQTNEPSPIIGQWEAIALTEETVPLEVEMSQIKFDFRANGQYDFHSTLNYREAGNYKIQSNYLLTTDTLHATAHEKMVKIESIQNDTLVLLMKKENKERKIKLIRK